MDGWMDGAICSCSTYHLFVLLCEVGWLNDEMAMVDSPRYGKCQGN